MDAILQDFFKRMQREQGVDCLIQGLFFKRGETIYRGFESGLVPRVLDKQPVLLKMFTNPDCKPRFIRGFLFPLCLSCPV